MKTLLNLITLNYNSLISVRKNLLILLVISIFITLTQPLMIIFFGYIFLMITCYSVIAYEERSKMNNLIYALPIKTNQYILSKYIYGFLNIIIAILISCFLTLIAKAIGTNDTISSLPLSIVALAIAGCGIFIVSIVLPCALILDIEKSRFFLIILVVIPISFLTPLVKYLPKININLNTPLLIILGILISITLLLTSYLITCNKFSKKEIS